MSFAVWHSFHPSNKNVKYPLASEAAPHVLPRSLPPPEPGMSNKINVDLPLQSLFIIYLFIIVCADYASSFSAFLPPLLAHRLIRNMLKTRLATLLGEFTTHSEISVSLDLGYFCYAAVMAWFGASTRSFSILMAINTPYHSDFPARYSSLTVLIFLRF